MSLAFKRNEQRHCSRCNKGLEDPASEEMGVGPICAKKNVTLLARGIPANYAMATILLLNLSNESFPLECQETFASLVHKVLKKSEGASRANEDFSEIRLDGQDLRAVIKDIDWILSHRLDQDLRGTIIKVVRALGYVELAAVLSQEASTTGAPLWLAPNGRVYLKGKSCKSGFFAMRKIPGIIVPKFRGSDLPYSAPIAQLEEFLKVVQDFWPLYEVSTSEEVAIPGATLATLRQEAQEWVANQPVPHSPSIANHDPARPLAKLEMVSLTGSNRGQWLSVSFPWIFEKTKEMYEMINTFKNITKGDRIYNPNTKSWLFRPQHTELVQKALNTLFTINMTQVGN